MIAIDTNLLVYAHRALTPQHGAARAAIERASRDARGWGIPLPCIAEFWSVATHPECRGGGSPPAKARSFLRALVLEAGARVWSCQEGSWERLSTLAAELGVRGPRVFDLQVSLTALENGATEIWSHDRAFLVLPGLALLDPL